MANYTLTLYEMMNNDLTPIFPEQYPFYTDDIAIKKEFEETFILHYLTNEIGFETPYLFNQKLLGRLKLIMPYYEQLYQTEWQRVNKDMMNQKDLTDTTIHTLTSTSDNVSSLMDTTSGNATTSQTDSGEQQSIQTTDNKQSMISDGVSSVSLNDGYLTGVEQGQQELSSNQSNSSTGRQDTSSSSESSSTNNTKVILEEKTTFTSHGDVGIQTPAYSILEWRKVIININQQIIEECRDLFMAIY